MTPTLAVRRYEPADASAAIIEGLPDYFTPDVPAKAERDAAAHEAWVLTDAGTVIAVAIAERRSPRGAEILWLAVDAARRGYHPYEATRAFWERNGFVYVDVIDPLPGWQPGSPAAIYVAALRITRD